jgi:hypothetical protein
MMALRHIPEMQCEATGLSKHSLKKIGERLSVDRINPFLGYVPGNCQVIAESLNKAKGRADHVPLYAINRLRRRASRVRVGKYTVPVWTPVPEDVSGTDALYALPEVTTDSGQQAR